MKKKIAIHQVLVITMTIAVIVVNILANSLPINGLSTGEVSNRFDIYFVPAAYVFSIWGVIYTGVIAYTIYQALPAQRDNPTLKRIAPYFIIGNLANIAWIFLWHNLQFLLTLPMMITIFITLLLIWLALRDDKQNDGTAFTWLVRAPISLYLGWISVATVANSTQVLYFYNWNGFGISPEAWAVIMLVIAAAIATAMLLRERDLIYTTVFIWAYVGIQVRHSDTPVVGVTALVLAIALAVLVILQLLNIYPKRESLAKPGTRATR